MSSLLEHTLQSIQPQDQGCREACQARLDQLAMPHWALGRLMDLSLELAGMTRSLSPRLERRVVVTMAADHGVVAEGVSAYPAECTPQMVHNFVRGGAGINALAELNGARVVVVDLGVNSDLSKLAEQGLIIDKKIAWGTANLAQGPAMTREQARRSLEAGIEVAQTLGPQTDIFATGDMGIGNTTPTTCILVTFTGVPVTQMTGRGGGVDDECLRHKMAVIERALEVNCPDPRDPLDVLAKVGGFEIGGIAGLILGAAAQGKPVLVDGVISTAGAMLAAALAPLARDYMIASHRGSEPGHRVALEQLRLFPLLDLGLRLGEGTGAALAFPLVEASVRIMTRIATCEEASVSDKL